MNELIEHFAERATKEMDQEAFSEDMNIPVEWYHKFAELIVRECANKVDSNLRDWLQDSNGTMGDKIKEHFGVEE